MFQEKDMDEDTTITPPAVLQAQEERPECSYSLETSTRLKIANGSASETTRRQWWQACPGERRKLLASTETTRDGAADELAGGGAEGGGFGAPLPFPFGGGGGDASGGFSPFPSFDDFLRGFLGARSDGAMRRQLDPGSAGDWWGRDSSPWGRFPFPFPLPRAERPPQLRGGDGAPLPHEIEDDVYGGGDGTMPRGRGDQSGWPGAGPSGSSRRGMPPALAERERGRGVYV